MSLNFDLDFPDIEVRVCPNTDKALAYLSKCHAWCEQSMGTRLKINQLEFKVWLLRDLKGERPEDSSTLIDRLVTETRKRWKEFLSISIEHFGEAATINAQFLIGDPWFPPDCE